MTVLLAEAVVPPDGPVPIDGQPRPAGVQREVPAGGVQVAGVARVVMTESVLLWDAGVSTARGLGAASCLVGAGWAFLTQRIGACDRDVVKLLQKAVDGCVFGWPVPSNDGLQKNKDIQFHRLRAAE